MNNSNKNYITAGILILLGLLFLGKEFNLFDFHWSDIARFWPVLLILIGLNIVFGGRSNGNSVILILCLLAIPFGLVHSCHNNWNRHGNNWNWNDRNEDNDNDDNDDDDAKNDAKNDDDDNNDDGDNNKISKSQNFLEEMDPTIKGGQLSLEGGIAGIEIEGTTTKLFEADTKSTFSDFSVSKTINNGIANVNFSMNKNNGNKEHIDIDSDNFDGKNEAKIKLNPNIEWSMDYRFGVAGAKLDLTPFNVKKLDIKTGVSGVELKIGDKSNDMLIDIDAGIAGINIKVPYSVGVRIKTDTFLSGNNFEGFTKDDAGYYISPDYNKSTKKIAINFKGAFAGFEVKRY